MSSGKQIKVQVSVDQTSFAQTKAQIQQLVDLTAKLGKNLQGAGGGGSGLLGAFTGTQQQSSSRAAVRGASASRNANAGLTDVVRQNLDLFKGLGSSGAASMGVLVDALKKATNQSQNELERQKRLVDSLTASYERLKAAGKDSLAEKRLGQVIAAKGGLASAASQHAEISEAMQAHYGGMMGTGPTSGAPSAAKGGFWSVSSSPVAKMAANAFGVQIPPGMDLMAKGGVAGTLAKGAGIAALVSTIVQAVSATSNGLTAVDRSDMKNRVGYGSLFGGEARKLMGGDYTTMIGLRQLQQDPRALSSYTSDQIKANDVKVALADSMGQSVAGVMSGGDPNSYVGEKLTSEQLNLRRQKELLSAADAAANAAQGMKQQTGISYLQSTLHGRINAAQILGIKQGGNRSKDPYTDAVIKAQSEGWSLSEQEAAVTQSRGMGLGGQFSRALWSAGKAGYGGYGNLLHSAAVNRGNAGAAQAAGYAMGGGIERTAGFSLGQMAFGINPRGVTGGEGFLSAVQSGFNFKGDASDQRLLGQISGGLKVGDSMLQGFDPFSRGTNLLTAMNIMPGASSYSQDYLANKMNMKGLLDAARGNLSENDIAHGVTQKNAQERLAQTASGVMNRWVDEGGIDPISKAMRKFRASGQSLPEFLKKNKGLRDELGAFASDATGEDFESSFGAMKLLSGEVGGKLKSRGAPGVGSTKGSTDIESGLEALNQQMRAKSNALLEEQANIEGILKSTLPSIQIFERHAAQLGSSTEQLLAAFDAVTQKFDAWTGRKPVEEKKDIVKTISNNVKNASVSPLGMAKLGAKNAMDIGSAVVGAVKSALE